MEEIDIVIVGGGIAGLATSLALHRVRTVLVHNGKHRELASPISDEARCLKRDDLVRALADAGSQIVSINLDETTSFPVLQLSHGVTIKAKVLIGCDGANSMVADFLKLSPKKAFPSGAVRGFAFYPNGHGFPQELLRMKIGNTMSGRLPVTHNLVFWFAHLQDSSKVGIVAKDQEAIANLTLDSMRDFPEDWKEMVKNCDVHSLSLYHLKYKSPLNIMFGKFRKGTVTVAGDAMHVMGPFIGQGGSAALEDAVVLARCLAKKLGWDDGVKGSSAKRIGEALDEYVNERRMRLVGLSTQTYLTGHLLRTSSVVVRLMLLLFLIVLFGRSQFRHTRYDCGRL
ncbi:PREDICTED: uncharacterized protein LOC104820256 isoform X2 [Tarenaya hassleriana]|uniref:uncharacterized protein LOC104820256 isoform X2 n=1 Tax=Tarenaya hassleriana TaxID=28532 RepID=UPI0008FD23B7|nr:PREDICTED: uncharacterized protein LOC104820256 isoform X2 [Tarenaya hassleriana]